VLCLPGQAPYWVADSVAQAPPIEAATGSMVWQTRRRIVVPGRPPPIMPPTQRPPRRRVCIGMAVLRPAPQTSEGHATVSWRAWNERAAALALLLLEGM
jgi:hypothetical protein